MRLAAPPIVVLAWLLCTGLATLHAQPNPELLRQRAQEGERALAERRYADAEKAYEALRALSPATPEVHARLGLIYFQQGKFKEAIPPLREAVARKPDLPNVRTLLAMSLSELGQYEEALPALEQGFARNADPVLKRMVGLHLQRAYTGLARDRDAVGIALELSRLHPDDPEVLYHASRLLANLAYLQAVRLARVAPDSVWRHQAAGEALESQGLHDAAIKAYRDVLSKAPRRPGIHFRIGRALLSRDAQGGEAPGGSAEAMREFEQELAIDATNANAAYEIGELHRKAADLDQARVFFERALTHYPQFDEALVGLGRTLVALGAPEKALPHLEAAVAQNPGNDVAYYQLAQAHGALGQSAEQAQALAAFTRIREGSPPGQTPPAGEPRRDVTKQEIDVRGPRQP